MPNHYKLPAKEVVMQQLEDIYLSNLSAWAKQRKIAAVLRPLAMAYLAQGMGPVAVGFRGFIQAPGLQEAHTDFLQAQGKDGAWGTDVEFQALCEFFQVHGMVSSINPQGSERQWISYRAESDSAPTVHLRNSNNVHWYVEKPTDTLADGNCLYNGLAVALQKTLFAHTLSQLTIDRPVLNKPVISDEQAIAFQRHLLEKVAKPSQNLQVLQQERRRIASLPLDQQQQINADHQLALKIAREDAQQAAMLPRLKTCKQQYVQTTVPVLPRLSV